MWTVMSLWATSLCTVCVLPWPASSSYLASSWFASVAAKTHVQLFRMGMCFIWIIWNRLPEWKLKVTQLLLGLSLQSAIYHIQNVSLLRLSSWLSVDVFWKGNFIIWFSLFNNMQGTTILARKHFCLRTRNVFTVAKQVSQIFRFAWSSFVCLQHWWWFITVYISGSGSLNSWSSLG